MLLRYTLSRDGLLTDALFQPGAQAEMFDYIVPAAENLKIAFQNAIDPIA